MFAESTDESPVSFWFETDLLVVGFVLCVSFGLAKNADKMERDLLWASCSFRSFSALAIFFSDLPYIDICYFYTLP